MVQAGPCAKVFRVWARANVMLDTSQIDSGLLFFENGILVVSLNVSDVADPRWCQSKRFSSRRSGIRDFTLALVVCWFGTLTLAIKTSLLTHRITGGVIFESRQSFLLVCPLPWRMPS